MDVSGALVVLAMLGIRILFTATGRRHEYLTDPQSEAKNPPPDDPRWLPSTDEPQVVGRARAHCHAA
ncbi:MAG TPA: hypothetical protein PK141_17310 [Polyangiaceae bacterium]|nr:hypothetical protein [Polyangiaceae bacterium]